MLQFKDTVFESNIDSIQQNFLMISTKDLKRDDINGYVWVHIHTHAQKHCIPSTKEKNDEKIFFGEEVPI